MQIPRVDVNRSRRKSILYRTTRLRPRVLADIHQLIDVAYTRCSFQYEQFLVNRGQLVSAAGLLNIVPQSSVVEFFLVTKALVFFTARAMLALQALYYLQQFRPTVRLSVCPSVRDTPVLCQNDGT